LEEENAMNFIEYLEEETRKEKYVLWNKKRKFAPKHYGETFETYAVSPKKAFHQILHRLRNDYPHRYMNEINANYEDYFVIPSEEYRNIVADLEAERIKNNPPPEPPPEPPKPTQGTLFPDPSRLPD
jgi:hypothetical protein